MLYREATGQGMSGSPLYFMDEKQDKAYVVGVHVGGSKILGNTAVSISYHMKLLNQLSNSNYQTIESLNSVLSVKGN